MLQVSRKSKIIYLYLFISIILSIILMLYFKSTLYNKSVTKEYLGQINYKIAFISWVIDIILTFLIPIIIIKSGISDIIVSFLDSKIKNQFVNSVIYYFLFSVLIFLFYFPLSLFGGYFRTHLLGLSDMPFYTWLTYKIKYQFLDTAISSVIAGIIFAIVRYVKFRWWYIVGLLFIPYAIISTLIYPVYIDPLFNKFTPMENIQLQNNLENLAEECGVKNVKIYVIDKSKETKTMNAYMTGIFNTKRIVLWDTTLKNMNDDEIIFTMAHELGHYVLKDIPRSIFLQSISLLIILYLCNITIIKIIKLYGNQLRVRSIYHLSIVPVFILVFNFYNLILTPIGNAYSRYTELEADKFALELTQNTKAAETSEVKFLEGNLSVMEPGAIYKLFNYDHPTVKERIYLYENYKPWLGNEGLKYEKYFNNK